MDKRMDIYKSVLNLADTTLEGIEHVYQRTMDGRFDDTAEIFTDVADSFHEIKIALISYLPDYEKSDIDQSADEVVEGMKLLLLSYEGDQDVRPMVVLQFSLLPAFRRWHLALQKELGQICAPSMN